MTDKQKKLETSLFERYINDGFWLKKTQFEQLEEQAAKCPDKIAVTDDERSLSFKQLVTRSRAYAEYFLSLGLKKGDKVIVQLGNSVSVAEILYACFAAGLVIHPMLMSYRETEINGVIENLEPALYIADGKYMGFDHTALAERCIAQSGRSVKLITLTEFESVKLDEFMTEEPVKDKPVYTDTAIIVSSSGSTGIPKLIERRHGNYINCQMTCADSIKMTPEDVDLIPMPLMHCWNLCGPGLVGSIALGCKVVISKYSTPDEIMRLTEKYSVTVAALVPSLIKACIEYRKYDDSEDISSLRVIQAGGSMCPPELVSEAMEKLGCTVQQIYGMSEGFVSATAVDDDYETIISTQGLPVCEGSEMKIVDQNGEEVPEGERGELLVRGPAVVTEYFKNDAANERSFTEDLFYRTGDEAVLDEAGRIKILGRVVELINRCGEKITPSEVEEMLLKIDHIKEAAVIGKPDPELGQKVCAFVTADDPAAVPDLAGIRKKLSEMGLASFKLPDIFEVLSEMPRTGVGKIDKKKL